MQNNEYSNMNNFTKNISEVAKELEAIATEAFSEVVKEKIREEYVFDFDPVNIVYRTMELGVGVSVMKFKEDAPNKNYSDLIGYMRMIMIFKKDYDKEDVKARVVKAMNLCLILVDAGVMQEEIGSALELGE